MLKTILTSGPVLALLAGCLLSGITWALGKLIAYLASKPKLAALEPLAEDAGALLTDEVNALRADLSAGKAPVLVLTDLGTKALADAKADLPDAAKALAAEVSVLVGGAPTSAPTPGGATVNLPDLTKKG